MTTKSPKKSVLLVDDDPEFLGLTTELLRELSDGHWDISSVISGGEALGRLQASPVDLIIFDVNMPVLDGVQLLGLLQRRYPSILKVVLTGEASPEQRVACLTAGAEMVLDKPANQSGWDSIHAALNSLLAAPREEGFQGVLRKVSLPDVIQMECLAGNSSVLEITGAGMRGRLHIKSGQIIHAEIGDLTGAEALNNMLCLPGGSFNLYPFSDPGRETISGQWEFLLMEAARVRDETLGATAGSVSAALPEILPDAAAIDAFTIGSARAEPLTPHSEAELSEAIAATKPKARPPEEQEATADTVTGMQPVVKETLVCSLQGEVLYEWNCPNALDRILLLEFITKRSSHMTATLPLGRLDRFEFMEKGTRCVARLTGDQALFVRVQSVLVGGLGTSATP